MIYNIGIRCQDKSVWQRRAPLSPQHLQQLLQKYPDLRFYVQPSKKRIWSDSSYASHGAELTQDLSNCHLILGIKQVPCDKLLGDRSYMYFSHTIKGQLQNMDALDCMLSRNIRMIDYQCIKNEDKQRLISFGKYAGMAGALDFLKGLGQYIMEMGINTPFLHANCSYKYFNLEEAHEHLKKIGKKIVEVQLPKELCPMIFAITGRGKTAKGCITILQNLPITIISPKEIADLVAHKDDIKHRTTIYLVTINTEDCIEPRDPNAKFDREQFDKCPGKYRCNFKSKYLPYVSAIFHCIFWAPNFPMYIKNKHLKELAEQKNLRLLGICDISCDLDGSIECLQKYTQPQNPFFYIDPLTGNTEDQLSKSHGKIMYLGIDFLPCELAIDASSQFSDRLKNWIYNIVTSNPKLPLQQQGLKPQLQKAVLTCNNKLMPRYLYIMQCRQQNKNKQIANTMTRKKQAVHVEVESTNTLMHHNVTIIPKEMIPAEKLDFNDQP